MSGERTPGGHGSEVAVLARALELAADLAGSPVSAQEASAAASAHPDDDQPWPDVAGAAARAVGLAPFVRGDPPLGLAPEHPALLRVREGVWAVAIAKRSRSAQVVIVDEGGEVRRTMSLRGLRELAGDQPWLHLRPLLALEAISERRDPRFHESPWGRLRAMLALERRDLWVILIYSLVVGALTLALPIAVQALVNSVAFGAVLQPLVVLSMLLFFGLTFAGLLRVLEAYVVEVLQRRVFLRVADDFGRRIPTLDPTGVEDTHVPELVHRFFEVVSIQKSLSVLLLDGLTLSLQTISGMLLLGFYHPLLLAFDVVLIALLLLVFWLGHGATATGLRESSAKYRTAQWLEDLGRDAQLFRGAAAQARAAERTDVLCRDYITARKGHFRVLLRQLAGGVGLQVFAMVSLLGVGGWLVIDRQLTLGQLVAAELVIAAIGAGLLKLGKNLEKLYDLNIGVLKLAKIVDLPTERRGGVPLTGYGAVGFSVGGGGLRRASRQVLSEVEFEIEAGESVALAGPAGSGKSTMLEVLAGVRASDVRVRIDGLALRRADLSTVRLQARIVRGASFVSGTLSDNVQLCSAVPLHDKELDRLLQLVGLREAVLDLPHGVDTPLLPSGAPLSSTQARRLSLARGLAGGPRALLLDGALDGLALEPNAKRQLLDHVLGETSPWTAIVVSEDEDVLTYCTRTLRIEGSVLKEATS